MAQTVDWTTSIEIAGIPFFAVSGRLQVQSIGRINLDIAAGARDRKIALLANTDEEIALLLVNGTRYVDPNDSSKTLQINVAASGQSLVLSSPLFLTDRQLLKAILGDSGILSITNALAQAVNVEVTFCRAAPPAPPSDDGGVGPSAENAFAVANEAVAVEDLTQIRGIGPTYQQRLQDAGFHTLADLAAASADEVKLAIGAQPSHAIDVASWIAQAQALIDGAAAANP